MSESNETKSDPASTDPVHQAEVADPSPATSIVDAAFDIGTKAAVDVLSFAHEALKKSAIALEESAKKLDKLTTALKH